MDPGARQERFSRLGAERPKENSPLGYHYTTEAGRIASMSISDLPTLNAALNSISAYFLIRGYVFIRRGKKNKHRNRMLAALITSILFLCSYLVYHYNVGSRAFEGEGLIRIVYFTILISHTVLATLIVPLVLLTLILAFRGSFTKHKKIAKWTLPLWLYVSLTGVLVYLFLYGL
jgi:uncharacterized membrane protein YozB (DUF420 family)